MGDTGQNWGSLTHAQYDPGGGSQDVDGVAVNDTASITTDEIPIDSGNYSAGEISVIAVEDDTGACDGDLIVKVLRSDNDPDSEGWQDPDDDAPWSITLTPERNKTKRLTFSIDLAQVSSCKIYVYNDAGQQLAITINYRFAQIPAAS